jgi:hypothetical protein
MSAPTICCAVCGSLDVQYAIWSNPNTGENGEMFGSWNAGDNTFCADCDMEGRDPNPDLIDGSLVEDKSTFDVLRAKRIAVEAKRAARAAKEHTK